jgi:hypothetical protein
VFGDRGLLPSFHRVSAAWRAEANPFELVKRLRAGGHPIQLAPSPVTLVYRQPAFRASHIARLSSMPDCPNAEQAVDSRFLVRQA